MPFVVRGSRRREREKWAKNLFEEIIAEKFPNMRKETDTHVQEEQRVSNKMNPKRYSPRHIIIKMVKIKDEERVLKAERKKTTSYIQENSHMTISQLFSRNFAGQKGVAQYIQSDERKNLQPRITYASRLSFRFEGNIKSFKHKQKLKEVSLTRLTLQEILKKLL